MFQINKLCSVKIVPYQLEGAVTVINCDSGRPFHIRRVQGEPFITMNLKPGKYRIENGQLRSIGQAVTYNLDKIKLPKADRDQNKAFTFSQNFDLKGPARIFPDSGVIEIGPKFHRQSEQIQDFILFHELGHFYYDSEENADAYALKCFLKAGGNQSAAYDALECVLTPCKQTKQRIDKLYNLIKKT